MALDALESESIEILREAVAAAERPVLLYSIGKDSSVLLHLARKAFHPGAAAVSRCCTSTPPGSSRRCTRTASA